MKKHRSRRSFLTIGCALWGGILAIAIGCENKPESASNQLSKPNSPTDRIIAVSYPLQYLTQRIAGDKYEVRLPLPSDADPEDWRPSREAISEMQSADLIIANGTGATYANWLTLVSLPDSKLRYTASKSLSLKDFIAVEDVTVTHSHGPEGEHTHSTMVARTWLDPAMAHKQATYIARELALVYPKDAEAFDQNLQALSSDLVELSKLFAKPDNPDIRIVTATPKLKFFARATGFPDRHLTWFERPTAEQARQDLNQFGAPATQRGLILFDNVLPNQELIGLLKSQNLTPIPISLIDQKPDQGDYLSAMRENISRLNNAIEELE